MVCFTLLKFNPFDNINLDTDKKKQQVLFKAVIFNTFTHSKKNLI